MSPFTTSIGPSRPSRFSSRPVEKLSNTVTVAPASSRSWTMCDPTNPAPPVMNTLLCASCIVVTYPEGHRDRTNVSRSVLFRAHTLRNAAGHAFRPRLRQIGVHRDGQVAPEQVFRLRARRRIPVNRLEMGGERADARLDARRPKCGGHSTSRGRAVQRNHVRLPRVLTILSLGRRLDTSNLAQTLAVEICDRASDLEQL